MATKPKDKQDQAGDKAQAQKPCCRFDALRVAFWGVLVVAFGVFIGMLATVAVLRTFF
jgi:hypothetical protein